MRRTSCRTPGSIAIESEREFGLSVLQRLDAELKRRGDLFRAAGVQDVAAYRDKTQATSLPRILLIVDEFQEFFVEDDKLSQEAALLARPPGAPGPGVRPARPARLADAGRGLLAGPQHHRPDGGPHRLAVQRGRRQPDPEQGQQRRPAAVAARRGDLQRRQRPGRRATTSSRSSGCRNRGGRCTWSGCGRWPGSGTWRRRRRRSCSRATTRPTSRSEPPAATADWIGASVEASGRRDASDRDAWLGDALAIKDPTGPSSAGRAAATCW